MNSFLTSVTVLLLLAVFALSTQFNIFNGKALSNGVIGTFKTKALDMQDIFAVERSNLTECEREITYKLNELDLGKKIDTLETTLQKPVNFNTTTNKLAWLCYKSWSVKEVFFLKSVDDYPVYVEQTRGKYIPFFEIKRDCNNCNPQYVNSFGAISLYWEIFPNRLFN